MRREVVACLLLLAVVLDVRSAQAGPTFVLFNMRNFDRTRPAVGLTLTFTSNVQKTGNFSLPLQFLNVTGKTISFEQGLSTTQNVKSPARNSTMRSAPTSMSRCPKFRSTSASRTTATFASPTTIQRPSFSPAARSRRTFPSPISAIPRPMLRTISSSRRRNPISPSHLVPKRIFSSGPTRETITRPSFSLLPWTRPSQQIR